MLISELLEGIREDFTALGQLGGPETASIAERLSAAIEPSLRTHFLEALDAVIQEFNLQDSVALTLNLEGDQIRMSRVVAPPPSRRGRRGANAERLLRANRAATERRSQRGHRAPRDGRRFVDELVDRSYVRALGSRRPDRLESKHPRQLRGKGRA